jgi:hypothetical protein
MSVKKNKESIYKVNDTTIAGDTEGFLFYSIMHQQIRKL